MASRRSTRARTGSQEPAAPIQSKAKSSQKKQQALAAVPESPAKRSAGAFSSITVFQPDQLPPVVEDDSEPLTNGLKDLWEISDQLINRILPDSVTVETIQDLQTRLQNAPRQLKDVLGQYQKLKDAMSIYPETPINVTTTCRNIFALGKDGELREGPHRPDEVLYKTNLAYVLGILVEWLVAGLGDCDFQEILQYFIQSLFSKVLKSNDTITSGSTSIFKATFDLALDLQTEAYIAELLDQITDGDTLPDPIDSVTKVFYKKDGSTLLGWNVQGLQTKQLSKSQRATIADRVTMIGQLVQNFEEDPELIALQAEFPIDELVVKFFRWAAARNTELTEQVGQVSGGPLGIQEAIDGENARRKAERHPEHSGRPVQDDGFAMPTRPAKTRTSKKDELYNAMRAGTSLSRPQSSAAASSITPIQSAAKKRKSIAIDQAEEIPIEPMLFVGDEVGSEIVQDDPPNEPRRKGLVPGEAIHLAQAVVSQDLRANKENYPEFPPSPVQQSGRPAGSATRNTVSLPGTSRDKGKRLHNQFGDDDDDGGADQYNDSQLSQDKDFETQATPSHGPTKRRRQQGSPSGSAMAPSSPSHALQSRDAQQISPDGSIPISQVNRQVNALAKELVAKIMTRKPPQKRTPWSEAETEHFCDLISRYGISWSAIKRIDQEHCGDILHARDQVSLKDKARNIKMDFLKSQRVPPDYLKNVALKSADKERLEAMDIDHEALCSIRDE